MGLMKLSLVALLALGPLAAGCGGDDETPPAAAPAETATTPTPRTEPFTYEPKSASEIALVAVEAAGTPGAAEGSAAENVGILLTATQQDCGNTLGELAGYTLEAISVLGEAGVDVLPTDVLIDVSIDALGAGG